MMDWKKFERYKGRLMVDGKSIAELEGMIDKLECLTGALYSIHCFLDDKGLVTSQNAYKRLDLSLLVKFIRQKIQRR